MSKVRELAILSFLSLSLIASCLIFSRGFLLNRQAITKKSKALCEDLDDNDHDLNHYCQKNDKNRQYFEKTIFILVDALRYDFIHRMHFLSSIIEEKEKDESPEACTFKFVADPPTTTMQRLSALMTGTMPTFIEASANFNSIEIKEDSLIYQLFRAKNRIAFFGDDTWLSLFLRKYFHSRSDYVQAHPSFNAWDLDTVDTAVNKSLVHLLQKSSDIKNKEDDWEVLIAHLLGVDHCGHRYGPNHPEMKRKLHDADATIQKVYELMSNDTLLIIFGDHGMTSTGDHGGDSLKETEAGLIFLTKKSPKDLPYKCISKLNSPVSISQIDLVPTASTLLRIPIPFSSLGKIIPDFFQSSTYTPAIVRNVAQVSKYIKSYPSFSTSLKLKKAHEKYAVALGEYKEAKNPSSRAELHARAELYLSAVKQVAISVWTQFDMISIFWGIGIFIATLIVLVTCVQTQNYSNILLVSTLLTPIGVVANFFNFGLIVLKGLMTCSACLCIGYFTLLRKPKKFKVKETTSYKENENIRKGRMKESKNSNLNETISLFLYFFSCLAVGSNSLVINEGYVIGTIFVAVAASQLLFSSVNYSSLKTIHSEPRDLIGSKKAFILKRGSRKAWISFLCLTLIVRVGTFFFRCREELTDCKDEFLLHKHLASLPEDWFLHKYIRYGGALLSLAVFVVIFREWMLARKLMSSKRVAAIIGKYVPSVLVVFICVFWALEGLPFAENKINLIRPLLSYFPLAYQLACLISIIILFIKPLCCTGSSCLYFSKNLEKSLSYSMEKSKTNTLPTSNTTKLTSPQSVNINEQNHKKNPKTKNSLSHQKKDDSSKPLINGTKNSEANQKLESKINSSKDKCTIFEEAEICENRRPETNYLNIGEEYIESEDVYSSTLLILCVLTTLLLVQVLPTGIVPGVTLIPYAIVCIIGLYSTYSNDSWSLAVILTLGSQYFFYATGHQTVFSAIPWDSAFIGSNDGLGTVSGAESYWNWIMPAFAVIGNLHVSQIIFSLSLPLLIYLQTSEVPESYFKTKERQKVFSLHAKFIALHALKLLVSMISTTHLRRHLMVWKIFAPKLIFEIISFLVICCLSMISLLFIIKLDFAYRKFLIKKRHKIC